MSGNLQKTWSMAIRWYVAATQPGREEVAELNLRMQGFDVWVPRQARVVSHARRRYEKRVAFFPGYAFLSIDPDRDRWRSVNGTFGVRSLIMQDGRPVPCPAGLVEQLQALTDENGLFNGAAGVGPGDAVRVVAGPFAELVGTLTRLDGAGRARILLQIMRTEIAVTLKVADLVPACA